MRAPSTLPRRSLFLAASAGLLARSANGAEPIDRTEVHTYSRPTPGSDIDTGGAVIDIYGSMDRVLAVVKDFRKYHLILPRLEHSRVVGKRKGHTEVYMRAPIMRGLVHVWGVARFAPVRRYGVRGKELAGTMVKGNLDGWHGAWRLYPCGQKRVVLRLEMFIDVQIPVPNRVVTRELEWATGKAVTAVRDIVECGESSVKDD